MTARERCKRSAQRAIDLDAAADLAVEPVTRVVLRVRARVADWTSSYWAILAEREIP